MSVISKTQFAQSQIAVAALTQVVGAIAKLDLSSLNDDVILHNQLGDIAKQLEEILATHNNIVAEGEAIKKSVDQAWVGQAFERQRKLNLELELNENAIATMERNYESRRQQAADLRIDVKNHKPLDCLPTDEDRERIANEKAVIELELSRINAFIMSAPFFDSELLVGTILEQQAA